MAVIGGLELTKEQIIEEAKICYSNCKTIITTMSEAARTVDAAFDGDNAIIEFDMVLQSLMFSQSVIDDDFCEAEQEFIKAVIAENDHDLFKYARIGGYEDVTWEKVFAMDIEEQKKLADVVNELMGDFADHFVTPFAVLDSLTTQNTLLDIATELTNLSILLAAVDGEILEAEIDVFQAQAEKLILSRWADIKGLALALDEETDTEE